MTTAAIIGAGDLGGAIAQALAARESVDRVLLVDALAGVAAGKALDIMQSGAVSGFHTTLDGTADSSRIVGCSVCIVADRAGKPGGEWPPEEALSQLAKLRSFIGDVPIVFAGVEAAPLLPLAVREAGFARQRLIGSAPEALIAAIKSIVAVEAACASAEVTVTVLGTPPSGFVVPWSDASIAGQALERALTPPQLARVDARVARLWPPGAYALGLAAATVVEGILASARRSFAVLSVLGGEFGVRGRAGTVPALLSPAGIVHTRVPSLTTRERVLVETALQS